jgi:Domain of unknown function (DUF4145)
VRRLHACRRVYTAGPPRDHECRGIVLLIGAANLSAGWPFCLEWSENLFGVRPVNCPHCQKEFHSESFETAISYKKNCLPGPGAGVWIALADRCPACDGSIIHLAVNCPAGRRQEYRLVYPKALPRKTPSPIVPEQFGRDFREACLVLADSPKASAALSRRCLQHVLKEAGRTTKKDLVQQIEEVLPTLPPGLRDLIDAVRVVGNFAAHPTKSTHTGEIIEVEPGEAELLLDVLEMAFDFYFVQPAEAQRRRDAINAKLAAAGKPPMK